jgi:hypothetical protein
MFAVAKNCKNFWQLRDRRTFHSGDARPMRKPIWSESTTHKRGTQQALSHNLGQEQHQRLVHLRRPHMAICQQVDGAAARLDRQAARNELLAERHAASAEPLVLLDKRHARTVARREQAAARRALPPQLARRHARTAERQVPLARHRELLARPELSANTPGKQVAERQLALRVQFREGQRTSGRWVPATSVPGIHDH